jgi:hypothetical protein
MKLNNDRSWALCLCGRPCTVRIVHTGPTGRWKELPGSDAWQVSSGADILAEGEDLLETIGVAAGVLTEESHGVIVDIERGEPCTE